MVCGVCGTRNVAEEVRCLRCGARLETPPVEPEPAPERELTAGERLATEAREQLAAGDIATALRSAQRAAIVEPDALLCRLVLGEVYLQMDADEDALRESRRAAELDPDNAEAKANAELARQRLTRRHEAGDAGPRDWRAMLVARKQVVAVAAGIVAGLLVFTVGAAAIVSRTSPVLQAKRAYAEQMRLGREHYQAGRYEDAARAFEQAARLRPNSEEAKRRFQDALAVAGLSPSQTTPAAGYAGQRMASIAPLNEYPPMQPRWVGPAPGSTQPGRPAVTSLPPPPMPDYDSNPVMAPPGPPEIPPPMPTGPDPNLSTQGPPRVELPPTPPAVGTEAPPEPPTTSDTGTPPGEPQKRPGHIVIRREAPRPAPVAPQGSASQPKSPQADALRAEANQLRNSGNVAAAARKYNEAAGRYRDEAAQGGAGAATKLKAAESCERAQQLCESQGN